MLLGLASSGLAAVAGSKAWASVPSTSGSSRTAGPPGAFADLTGAPLAGTLALVLLAVWGVLLVTRGRTRRALAGFGVLVALGLIATVVHAGLTLPATVDQALEGGPSHLTGWFWTGVVLSLVVVAPLVLAVRLCPDWPEMSSRYDAPAAAAPSSEQPEDLTDRDLWNQLSEGHDPTTRREP